MPTNRELVELYFKENKEWSSVRDVIRFAQVYEMPSHSIRGLCYNTYRKHVYRMATEGILQNKTVYNGKVVRRYFKVI